MPRKGTQKTEMKTSGNKEEFVTSSAPVQSVVLEKSRSSREHPLYTDRANTDRIILWGHLETARGKITSIKNPEELRRLRGLAVWRDRLDIVKIIDEQLKKVRAHS